MQSTRNSSLALLATLAFALVGAGCESYRSPELSVVDARAVERTEAGTGLRFTLDATNENDVALPLREVTYTLDVDGRRVFSATRSPEATLRRQGTQQFVLPAVIPTEGGSGGGGGRYRLAGTLTYVTPGQIAELLFDTGVSVPSVGFSFEGEVPTGIQPAPTN